MYRLASSNVTREHGHAALACGRAADLLAWSRVGPRNRPLAVNLDRHIYH